MREKFFRFLLTKLERGTPGWIKSMQIQILLDATAVAFERPGRLVCHLSAEKALAAYAAYTRTCMQSAGIDRKRVFRCACGLGRRIRKITGFTGREDRERLVFYLYSNIGIKVTGRLPGEIIIPVCYFAKLYTAKQCMTMSLMDWGIISGICGAGKLVFTERITQGCGCGRCRAVLQQKQDHSCVYIP